MQIKHTTLFLLLAGTTAFSQVKTNQKVTIETKSNAFLDASENTTGQGSNIGKGILFPQTDLSTFTLDISAADGINYPTYFDGMIVYNTHEGDATTDPSLTTQTENLEKGFYYFSNPTGKDTQSIANGKWVKISDAQASASEWKYNPDNKHIELVRSGQGDFKNKVYFDEKGRYKMLPVDVTSYEYYNGNTWVQSPLDVANSQILVRKTTKDMEYSPSNEKILNMSTLLLNDDAPTPSNGAHTVNNSKAVVIRGNTQNYNNITGAYLAAVHNGSGRVNSLKGSYSEAQQYLGESGSIYGSYNKAYVHGDSNTDFMYGAFLHSIYEGNGRVKSLKGSYSYGIQKSGEAESVFGSLNQATTMAEAGADYLYGVYANTLTEKDVTKVGRSYGFYGGNSVKGKASISKLHALEVYNSISSNSSPSITDMVGLKYHLKIDKKNNATPTIVNNYGLWLDDIAGGTEKNYAIYTGLGKVRFGDNVGIGVDNPTEKLEVNGKAVFNNAVRLKSNRGVIHSIFNYQDPSHEDYNPLYIGAGQNADGKKNDIILYNLDFQGGTNVPNIKLYADLTTAYGDLKVKGVTQLEAQEITAGGECTSGAIGYGNDGNFYACKDSQWKQMQLAQ